MEKKTIGSFISALRRAAGMTQRDLAEQLNVSDKAVSRWERDESAPDLTLLPLIADLFGITVDELLRGQRNTPAPGGAPTGERLAQEHAPAAPDTKRQKMLFGNRLRKQRMLNYIPLGLFAVGVIAIKETVMTIIPISTGRKSERKPVMNMERPAIPEPRIKIVRL